MKGFRSFKVTLICVVTGIILCQKASADLQMENWKAMSNQELEEQMSPSRWNPIKSPEEVIQSYINHGIYETNETRKTLNSYLDIYCSSSGSHFPKLDIYGTDLPNDSAIFMWIHGGYWQEGSKDISGGVALTAYSLGIKTAVLGYNLAPKVKVGDIEIEVRDAVKYIAKEYPKSKIIIGGHSAGAQLAADLLYQSNEFLFTEIYKQLAGMVLISGVYDLRPLVDTYVNKALKMTIEEAESLSPILKTNVNTNFHKEDIKILFMIASFDSPEYQLQSQMYNENLESLGFTCDLHTMETDDHFTIVENLSSSDTGTSSEVLKHFLQQFL